LENNLKYEVNIDLANETKKEMAKDLVSNDKNVLNHVGAFASLYDISFVKEYDNPVLVTKTEEPGSKQLIAAKYNKMDGIAYDMINHLINDCIAMGAKPITVQDAIICGKLNKEIVNLLVKSMADACRTQECTLIGGETSEQPGVIGDDTYILTSSIVAVVDKKKIIDGSKIAEGDIVLGLESSGLHTNGYTLVRQIMEKYPQIIDLDIDGKSFIDTILEPHRCYYQTIKDLFELDTITGLAHITGGGICENLDRILPRDLDAVIDASTYDMHTIFKVLKEWGNIDEAEMLRTYNLGIGMAAVTKKEYLETVKRHIQNKNVECREIGEIVKGKQKVLVKGNFKW